MQELFGSDDDDYKEPEQEQTEKRKKKEKKQEQQPPNDDDGNDDGNDDDQELSLGERLKQLCRDLQPPAKLPPWDRDTVDVWLRNSYLDQSFDTRIVQETARSRVFERSSINDPVYIDVERNEYVLQGEPRCVLRPEPFVVETFLSVSWRGFEEGEPFPEQTECLCRTCLGRILPSASNPRGVPLGLPVRKRYGSHRARYMEKNDATVFRMLKESGEQRTAFDCLPVFCSPACVRTFNGIYLGGVDKERRWTWFTQIAKTLKIDRSFLQESGTWGPPRELNELVTGRRNDDHDVQLRLEQQLELVPRNVKYDFVPTMYVTQERLVRSCTYMATRQKVMVLRDKLQLNSNVNDTFEILESDLATPAPTVNTNVSLSASAVSKKKRKLAAGDGGNRRRKVLDAKKSGPHK